MIAHRDLAIRFFGEPSITFRDLTRTIPSGKALSFFAYVLLHRDGEISRDALASVLWPDHPEHEARANVRRMLYRVQHELAAGQEWIVADARSLSWNARMDLWFDVDEFRSRVRSGERLEEAVDLYRGDLLPSLDDEWLIPERERLRELLIQGLMAEATRCLRAGTYVQGIDHAKRALQVDPWREEAFRCLFTLRVKSGDRAGALRDYQSFESELKRELQAAPMAETADLLARALQGAPIGDDTPNNLPAQLTSFIGREADLAELEALIRKSRLVTLVGTGGIGKTRLALQAAANLAAEFKDGAWFVDLAAVSDGEYVISAIASALGIVAVSLDRALQETVIGAAQKRHMVLLLDNCEHVLAAVRPVVAGLLQKCSELRILCTSREPLTTEGEEVVRLSGLPQGDAVALFVERARAADKQFGLTDRNVPLVAAICLRIDGIPLAIELAAPRVHAVSLKHIQQRLEEHFRILTSGDTMTLPRHRTMRALIDWSYGLLSPQEQLLLRLCAVFAGGFTLDAAAALFGDAAADEVLNLLSSLIAKSLVLVEAGPERERYNLLQTTQQYAQEKLRESGEHASACERHVRYFSDLVRRADDTYGSANAHQWLDCYGPEIGNVRAAIEYSLQNGDAIASALLTALARELWLELGLYAEGLHRAQRLLEALGEDAPPSLRAGLWLVVAQLGNILCPAPQARHAAQQAADAFEALGDEPHLAYALQTLGFAFIRSGAHEEAESALLRAQALAERFGNRRVIMRVLLRRGHNAAAVGACERALPLYERCLQVARAIEDDLYAGYVFGHLANVRFLLHDVPRAVSYGRAALEIFQRRRDPAKESNALANLAECHFALGDLAQARETAQASLEKAIESESTVNALQAVQHLAAVAAVERRSRPAAHLLGYLDAALARLACIRAYGDAFTQDSAMEALHDQLSDTDLQRLMSEGAGLSDDEAFALAVHIAASGANAPEDT